MHNFISQFPAGARKHCEPIWDIYGREGSSNVESDRGFTAGHGNSWRRPFISPSSNLVLGSFGSSGAVRGNGSKKAARFQKTVFLRPSKATTTPSRTRGHKHMSAKTCNYCSRLRTNETVRLVPRSRLTPQNEHVSQWPTSVSCERLCLRVVPALHPRRVVSLRSVWICVIRKWGYGCVTVVGPVTVTAG